eukprot:TRINITY_DN5518_c0_g1_i1.p3 TRINITY_DN5518_c0_g1~~TRINITY_DN5518_c0_g1_i1.p3  ORF type:complete len:193 (-),score=79.61 TRINITY_DN5518_c0_g1_i1:178-711(-)
MRTTTRVADSMRGIAARVALAPFHGGAAFLPAPRLRLSRPPASAVALLSPSLLSRRVVLAAALLSYACVLAGVIYDVIVEPPSVGTAGGGAGGGAVRPVAFVESRINGQFIIEGLAAGFLFVLGGLGFIVLDQSTGSYMLRRNRVMLFTAGVLCVFMAYVLCLVFITKKVPGYIRFF